MFHMGNTKQIIAVIMCMMLIVPIGYHKKAHASGIPVVDVASLAQAILDGINQATQISNQISQIQNQVQQIQNQARSLQTLGNGGFTQLAGNFTQQLGEIQGLVSSAQSISFNLGNIQSEFDGLFPQGSDWSTIDSSQFGDFYRRWNDSIKESAQVAMQSQSVIDRIQQRSNAAQNILSSSNGADGEVRQLQASNQMLSVLSQQMSDMTQTMATSGRVTASMAAKSASAEQAKNESSQRARNNYTDKGTPTSTLSQLPGR